MYGILETHSTHRGPFHVLQEATFATRPAAQACIDKFNQGMEDYYSDEPTVPLTYSLTLLQSEFDPDNYDMHAARVWVAEQFGNYGFYIRDWSDFAVILFIEEHHIEHAEAFTKL